jgi:hypothetical protein
MVEAAQTGKENHMNKIKLLGLLEGLACCALQVVDTWDEGDLAAAVREMHRQAKNARRAIKKGRRRAKKGGAA